MNFGVGGLSVPTLINRIDECLLPDDREPLLDYLEMLESKISGVLTKQAASIQFSTANGTQSLIKVMQKMINDEVTLRFALNIFDLQRKTVSIMIDFLKMGGLEVLNDIITKHAEDQFLMAQAPRFRTAVLLIGGNQAIQEIEHEGVALQLCQSCQETVERTRRLHSSAITTNTKFPKASERVNRVVMFMESYPDKVPVIQAGLDALIYFARNSNLLFTSLNTFTLGDSKNSIEETKMISCICQLLPNFKEKAEIVWRVFLCLSQACQGNSELFDLTFLNFLIVEIAVEVTRYNIHEMMVEIYPMHTDSR